MGDSTGASDKGLPSSLCFLCYQREGTVFMYELWRHMKRQHQKQQYACAECFAKADRLGIVGNFAGHPCLTDKAIEYLKKVS